MKKPLSLCILSGILIGTSYIPFPPWAIFFCFAPLWAAWLKAKSWKQIFLWSWITQFILTLIGFNWVAYTIHEFGNLPWVAAVVGLLLFAGFANLQLPLASLFWYALFRKERSLLRQITAMVVLTAIAERLYPMIFEWHFGYTWLWAGFPAYQLADICGFFGLSTIGLIFNGIILWAFQKPSKRGWDYKPIAWVVALFLALNVWGWWKANHLPKPDQKLSALIIQANIGDQLKQVQLYGPTYFKAAILNRYYSLTRKGLEGGKHPTFAIWPETAYPDVLSSPEMNYGYANQLREFLKENDLALVTGGYGLLPTGQYTNSMFVLNNHGLWADPPYNKTELLAFGEYLPGADIFPVLKQWLPQVADFGRGHGPQVMNLNGVKLGGSICYEGLFDWFSRKLANDGAQILINTTNDSWYGTWEQPYQHVYMTFSRAIETRRPLIRSTNTGISSVILSDGRILERSPLHKQWQHLYQVPYLKNPPATIFMSWGYWIFPVLLAGSLLWLLVERFRQT